ncbi:MAG TPA: sodium-dependent transporter [Desulfobacterales bacterium]|nr:sodium-dependent transporter [Desulfobacterales bacterium]
MKKGITARHRPQWQTHAGFLLAAIGSAIGLGNIWRFPYLCYKNGGGAFLIPYFLALVIVGIPFMILEIGLGHKMRGSAPASYARVSTRWEWLGWWQVLFVMFGIVLYYSVVVAWCLYYLLLAFGLSWGADPNAFFFNDFLMVTKTPFEVGNIRLPILFSLAVVWFLNWVIVFRGVQQGLEKANKLFMPLLFSLILILVGWSISLPGSSEGIGVYLKPDFEKLKDIGVWIDAVSQIFFTLSIAFGILVAYASYLPKKSQIVKDSVTISIANCSFSLIAGIGVFSVLGYMAHKLSVPIDQVVSKSIGLAFVVFPKAIGMLPAFSQLFGVLFFSCLVIAGLSSSVSIMEAFVSSTIDKFHYSRKTVVSGLAVAGFFGSTIFTTQGGIFWLDIVDHFLTQYGLVLAGILECILVGWIYRAYVLREHINSVSQLRLLAWWDHAVKIVIPVTLAVILVNGLLKEVASPYEGYPWLAIVLIGRDWVLFTLFFAVVVAGRPWKA